MKEISKMEAAAARTLKKILKDKKLSIHGLTRLINDAGYEVTHPTIWKWMKAPHCMQWKNILIIAKVLEIDILKMHYILMGEENNSVQDQPSTENISEA